MSEGDGDHEAASENAEATDGGTATVDAPARVAVGDGTTLSLPTEATADEAAAIVAAVGAHLTDLDRAAAADDGDESDWRDRRWRFAGRTEALLGDPKRATENTPTDAWTAAGRADRL